ncbi:uncharacterized protein LOC134148452 isoform X14 [Rhea pennata]|uniref:uncharacterized protein LOC134148452 isoform X14 n=1 Tax=Rhea pennata TaxID=8795 RepID=UPI002E267316
MKHGAGGPKHSEEVSANQLLLRALAGQSPGAITPASSESLRTQRRHQPRNWPILSWLTAAVMEAGERRRRRKRRRKRERENREQHLRKSEKLLQDLDTAEMDTHKFRAPRPGRRVLSQSHFLPRTADRKGFVQKHPNNKTKQNKAKQNKKHPCVLTFKIQIYYANSF